MPHLIHLTYRFCTYSATVSIGSKITIPPSTLDASVTGDSNVTTTTQVGNHTLYLHIIYCFSNLITIFIRTQPYVTALTAAVRSKNGCFINAGDSTGRLLRYLCSGKLVNTMQLTDYSVPVSNVITSMGLIVASVGRDIVMLNANKFKRTEMDCSLPGTISKVRGINTHES